jgi:hypothetical protein
VTTLVDVGGIPVEVPETEPERAVNRRKAYTPEECIRLAHVWAREVGAPPTKRDWNPSQQRRTIESLLDRMRMRRELVTRFREGGYPSDITIRKLFGSWNAFIHAAGWEPRDGGRPPIQAATEPPKTPTLEQVRRKVGHRAEVASFGRNALASVVRSVLAAEQAGDTEALHAVLMDGAAQLLAWAEYLERKAESDRKAVAA